MLGTIYLILFLTSFGAAFVLSILVLFTDSLRAWAIWTSLALASAAIQLFLVIALDLPFGLTIPPMTTVLIMIPSGYWLIVLLARANPTARFKPALGLLAIFLPIVFFLIWGSTWK